MAQSISSSSWNFYRTLTLGIMHPTLGHQYFCNLASLPPPKYQDILNIFPPICMLYIEDTK